ncbi:putative FHY3/FAR1 family protein [Helianthus debilis subsp. tardiflorus]
MQILLNYFYFLGVFKYVYDNWLKDYKEMFVFAWTDKRRNFGNRTTNRVESQHANLKRYVEDRTSLDRVVGCVRDIVETQFGEIRKTFRESIEKTMKHHKHPMFQHLLGKVSHKALDLLHGEAIRKLDVLERFNSSCGCQMWHSCGLPCACRIEKYMREERPIQLEDIDVFWRKLNFQSCKLIDDSLDVVEELDIVRQQLQSHPPAQQKSLLSKIKAVLTPTKSTKKPPVVQQNTRGRPTIKQVQERLDEASRIDEELRRSSFGDANTCFEGSRQSKYDKPRHSSYVPSQASQQSVIRSQKPKATLSRSKSSKKKETRDDYGFPLIIGDEYVGIIERFKYVGLYLSIRRGIVFLIWRTRRPTGSCWSSSFRHSHFTLLGSQCRFRTQVSFRLAGVQRSMTLAEFAVRCGLYMQEEIETEIYTAGLVVVEKPTLVGFWQVIAGENHWEYEKSKGRVSFVRDPLYRYLHHLLATSISARGYSREWCTTTDLFFLYCLLYRRPCALAHGLAQYFASGHHRQERGFLYGGAYVTVIARSFGLVPHQDPHLRTPAIMPTRMGMQSLWGMRVIKRFPVGPRFKNPNGGVWTEQPLPEHFEDVYPPADPADVVPVEDPPEDLDGPAVPQPPPPAGAPQFPRHVIRGHAPGAALHPDVRAELDRLNDLVGWLVRAEQDRREREGLPPIPLPPVRAPHQQHQQQHQPQQQQHQDSDSDLDA